jgi:Bacterial Ig domain
MKKFLNSLAFIALTTGALAQTNENFNSTPSVPLTGVKGYLQGQCWQFPGMDANQGQWNPGIEGDGAMVSSATATATQNTGIYSPQMAFGGGNNFSFKYKFDADVTASRWMKIIITDGNNNPVLQVDNVDLTGKRANNVYTYANSVNIGSGCFKLYINYQGEGTGSRIAIDELTIEAGTCYSGGCNQPPIAVNDAVAGSPSRTASGTVLPNDSDPNSEPLTAQLVTNSIHGNVVLNANGSFTFTPHAGFTGTSTTFTYLVCDNGSPVLCSNIATVTLTFPVNSPLPTSLVDLTAAYENSNVVINWASTFEENSDHFDIERSVDGVNFKSVGIVKAQGTSAGRKDYSFADDVSNSTARKNDLYYRLKLVDKDGKTAFSKILVVRVYKTKSLQSVSVTPNPAVNDIKVKVQLNENSYIVIKVMNNSGAEIMRKSARGVNGGNDYTLEGSSRLQTGVYYLEVIINSNERMMVKLIKN